MQAHAESFRKGALGLSGPEHPREAKRPAATRTRRRRRPADPRPASDCTARPRIAS